MFKKLAVLIGIFSIGISVSAFNSSWGPELLRWGHDAEIKDLTVTGTTSFSSPVSSATYASDSDLLDGYNYDYFVDTVTVQSIGGAKTFNDAVQFDATVDFPSDGVTIASTRIRLADEIRTTYGADNDFSIAYDHSRDHLAIVIGADVGINKLIEITDSSVAVVNTYLKVGDGGTMVIVDGPGDAYIEDEFEVGGATLLGGTLNVSGNSVLPNATVSTQFLFLDGAETRYGTGNDYSIGYAEGRDHLVIVEGASVDANKLVEITDSSTTFNTEVVIGGSGTRDYTDGDGDLYVEDELEVDGYAYFAGNLYTGWGAIRIGGADMKINDDYVLLYGSGNDYSVGYNANRDIFTITDGNILGTSDLIEVHTASTTFNTEVVIGSGGTRNYTDGEGDLYVEDELEVDGKAYFGNDMTIANGVVSGDGNLNVVQATGNNSNFIDLYEATEVNYPNFQFRHSNTDDMGVKVESVDGAVLGKLIFRGVDTGSAWDSGVEIKAVQNGAAGAKVPTDLIFETYGDTSKNTDQLKLHSDGGVSINAGYLQLYNRTTAELQAITPTDEGQEYWNTDTNEYWVSTGTLVNQFIHK